MKKSSRNKASFLWINTEPGLLYSPQVKIVFWLHPNFKWATWPVKIMTNIIRPYDNASVFVVTCNISCLFKGNIQYLILNKTKQAENCVINVYAHFVTFVWPFVSSILSNRTDLNMDRRMFLCVNFFFFLSTVV